MPSRPCHSLTNPGTATPGTASSTGSRRQSVRRLQHPRRGPARGSIRAPAVGPGCRLSGGSWFSYYDGTWVTAASGLDVDHMTPLAEAWDSGASAWTPARREAYDLAADTSLVAVTARSNRAKADKDPAQWLPPAAEVHCQYAAEWTGTKLRWNLAADEAEQAALRHLAQACPGTTVTYQPAP